MKSFFRSGAALPHMYHLTFVGVTAGCLLQTVAASAAPTLVGWANLPAVTTSPGPTSGQFVTLNDSNRAYLPIVQGQPVQGFSAVLPGEKRDTYHVMSDNGFGSKGNSGDALLRMYAVQPEFKTWNGRKIVGSGTVSAVDFDGRRTLPAFKPESFITLRDPNRKLGFKIQADYANYYDVATNPPVDPAIKAQRLLTGADFDIEAVRRDCRGNLWFGEEFGPFLVKTDETGKVLRSEIPLPNIKPKNSTATGEFVQSPSNPYLVGPNNLNNSSGFEGMAVNKSGDKLYTMLEGVVIGDPEKSLRIDEFSIDSERYTGKNWLYKLEAQGTNIGDFTAVNDSQFIVIERNGNTATTPNAPYKRLFLVDFDRVDTFGYVAKTELVDLMNIADPHDLNGDQSTLFTFPYVTIEDVLPVDSKTLLVINDNNFPGSGGRTTTAPDTNEFLLIRLDSPLKLKVDERPRGNGKRNDDRDGRDR